MAIKKSELYSNLWQACDELRGKMDASQYKDYILTLLFVKYISDKYSDKGYGAPVKIPEGASFKDMVKLKGKPGIGDAINKQILVPIAESNPNLSGLTKVDFADDSKLGKGKEMVDRLSSLISIFEDDKLDFSKNKADGDDILGDAYEYLMRHFATESGKSKGQFYTPAEVSRTMAKLIGTNTAKNKDQTLYDPTCGSGSLLLKAAAESPVELSIYGQEMDEATSTLAKMNMYLHEYPDAEIYNDNTLSNPFWKDGNKLKTFDYIVANPPFSTKSWASGFDPENDEYNRFEDGIPPTKNGDFAFLLHILKSLKQTGKGAVILPHGVLFRGNKEAEIRKAIIKRGYVKGIIGLPANLFYGTGIPACIILLDKENSQARKGIFMIDASKGFLKDGNKNKLRDRDVHRIVKAFNNRLELEKYSRLVPNEEIEENEYNLNIPRYIDTQEEEDTQDIEAHLLGGIPNKDIEALSKYWGILSNLRKELFENSKRQDYSNIKISNDKLRDKISENSEFLIYKEGVNEIFNKWKYKNTKSLKELKSGFKPKELVGELSEEFLKIFVDTRLIDEYSMYQYFLSYCSGIMQDDLYLISLDGWKAEVRRILEKDSKGKEKYKGWICDLIPNELIEARYFPKEREEIRKLEENKEKVIQELNEIKEEHSGEDDLLSEVRNDKDEITKTNVVKRIKEISKNRDDNLGELSLLDKCLVLLNDDGDLKKEIKSKEEELDGLLLKKYPQLSEDEIRLLVIEDKWMKKIESFVQEELENVSQKLTQRIKELSDRYGKPLPEIEKHNKELEVKVNSHLKKMGFNF